MPAPDEYAAGMQPSSANMPTSGPPSFAGMLADLAAPEKKFPPARELDGLEDDVATISYEQALRAHARFRPQAAPQQKAAPVEAGPPRQGSLFPTASVQTPNEPPRKSASVTVRMSAEECERLRKRAGEAGMTVSSYLRSCAFEVETLRTQVKDTLAQLRSPARQTRSSHLWRWLRRG